VLCHFTHHGNAPSHNPPTFISANEFNQKNAKQPESLGMGD